VRLVLASGSPARQMLLQRLGRPFTTLVPDISERERRGETAAGLAGRLAEAKAEWGAGHFSESALIEEDDLGDAPSQVLVIGSDQTAELDGELLRKPGNARAAAAQLKRASGREVRFHTGLALLNATTGSLRVSVEPFSVVFRDLDKDEIRRYVQADHPFSQVGAFKAESLGISLFTRVSGLDPTALIGLPLIRLTEFLRAEGVRVP